MSLRVSSVSKTTIFILCALFSLFPFVCSAQEAVKPGAGVFSTVDGLLGSFNTLIAKLFFFDVLFFTDVASLPLTVAWLVAGSIFFTIRARFINIRAFRHAIDVVRGRYDEAHDEGEVTHFQALSAALSATVGLGNIAGVALAVSIGGPGATFWMIVAGFLGMNSKLVECSLGQIYRVVRSDGHVMGGAMEYLSRGLGKRGHVRFGKVLAVLFCILCIGGSFGGGNAFQVNQSLQTFNEMVPFFKDHAWLYGLIMAALVAVVILGGIKRIAQTAETIVPFMCGLYILACLWIILRHFTEIPSALWLIVSSAFSPEASYGGFVGVLVTGFQRAAFSNEAGIGSAAIAHSAARTKYPVREGIVALLEPFIDTIVVCTMTALVVVMTGAYNNPAFQSLIQRKEGAALTSAAFGSEISWFPYVLTVAVVLFAYSTMISWSYYGERCWTYLFGERYSLLYRLLFVLVVFLGSIISSTNVLDFSDFMVLGMAFPNILGLYFLSGEVMSQLKEYMKRYREGGFVLKTDT
jgi:alanine or glycine:cation symporter, AGCS family